MASIVSSTCCRTCHTSCPWALPVVAGGRGPVKQARRYPVHHVEPPEVAPCSRRGRPAGGRLRERLGQSDPTTEPQPPPPPPRPPATIAGDTCPADHGGLRPRRRPSRRRPVTDAPAEGDTVEIIVDVDDPAQVGKTWPVGLGQTVDPAPAVRHRPGVPRPRLRPGDSRRRRASRPRSSSRPTSAGDFDVESHTTDAVLAILQVTCTGAGPPGRMGRDPDGPGAHRGPGRAAGPGPAAGRPAVGRARRALSASDQLSVAPGAAVLVGLVATDDVGAQDAELADQVLVAAVDVVDAVDDRLAVGGQGRHDECRAGPDVRRLHRGAGAGGARRAPRRGGRRCGCPPPCGRARRRSGTGRRTGSR